MAGFGFRPMVSNAEVSLLSSSLSSLKDLEGLMSFKIKSLISSPLNVSYISKAFAILCRSSILSVRIFFALS